MDQELYVRETVMTKFEKILCVIGLSLLKRRLNTPKKFESWVKKGINTIIVWNPLSYAYLISSRKKIWKPMRFKYLFHTYKTEGEDYYEVVLRQALTMLKDNLNDAQAFSDLVAIGTRWLTMPYPPEAKTGEKDYTAILISNNVGCAWPNSDYSLCADGTIWYHS